MNRAMFSGVAGLKAHQTKMDVIGNNIANVNTYGYKAQRAVFSDVYYQTLRGATGGTSTSGGTNPSSVGYGSTLNSIQSQMSTSSMQSTGFGMDVAIAGEGFLQVMDGAGNTFYTRAGMLTYDATGYLTDINGNYVLGASGKDGEPGSQKIKLDNIGSVEANKPSSTLKVNGIEYTITSSKASTSGNLSFALGSSEDLPAGQSAKATISSTGAITVQLNAFEKFTDMAAVNTAINAAIKEANGGAEHPGGEFTFETTSSAEAFAKDGGLTGAQIVGSAGGTDEGGFSGTPMDKGFFNDLMTIMGVSSDFDGKGTVDSNGFTATLVEGSAEGVTPVIPASWKISMSITEGGKTTEYTGSISEDEKAGSLLLKSATGKGTIEVSNPGFDKLTAAAVAGGDAKKINGFKNGELTVEPSSLSSNLGLGSQSFVLTGGTEGGVITLDQLANISIGADGTVSVNHAEKGTVIAGKISLANFSNPSGLLLEGSNYYSATANSGEPVLCDAGEGGTGGLKNSALEMSNVDLSEQFAEMITTQRGFQASSRIITVTDTMLEELINLKR